MIAYIHYNLFTTPIFAKTVNEMCFFQVYLFYCIIANTISQYASVQSKYLWKNSKHKFIHTVFVSDWKMSQDIFGAERKRIISYMKVWSNIVLFSALYSLEEDWTDVVGHESALGLDEKTRSQQTALWELVETEVAYIRTLKVIQDVSKIYVSIF